MKKYHPRRRTRGLELYKQSLHDLTHKISSDIGSLIVLFEEGNQDQITAALQKAKSVFLKHSAEMQQIAQKMGDKYARIVRDYLESVDIIIHSDPRWLDAAKINHCYTMARRLERELAAAA